MKKKRWAPTPEQMKHIEQLSGYGSPLHEVAAIMGVSSETLERAIKKSDAVRDTIERGKAKVHAAVGLSLYRQAVGERLEIKNDRGEVIDVKYVREPNVSAAIFYAKTRMRWRETDPEEDENRRVVLILPQNGRETKEE